MRVGLRRSVCRRDLYGGVVGRERRRGRRDVGEGERADYLSHSFLVIG